MAKCEDFMSHSEIGLMHYGGSLLPPQESILHVQPTTAEYHGGSCGLPFDACHSSPRSGALLSAESSSMVNFLASPPSSPCGEISNSRQNGNPGPNLLKDAGTASERMDTVSISGLQYSNSVCSASNSPTDMYGYAPQEDELIPYPSETACNTSYHASAYTPYPAANALSQTSSAFVRGLKESISGENYTDYATEDLLEAEDAISMHAALKESGREMLCASTTTAYGDTRRAGTDLEAPTSTCTPAIMENRCVRPTKQQRDTTKSRRERNPQQASGGLVRKGNHTYNLNVESQRIKATPFSVYERDEQLSTEWYPGFNRSIGDIGRKLLLKEIREYHSRDPQWTFDRLSQAGLDYSEVRFMKVSQLYHYMHALGAFEYALKVSFEFGSGQRKSLEYATTQALSQQHDGPPKDSPPEEGVHLFEDSHAGEAPSMPCASTHIHRIATRGHEPLPEHVRAANTLLSTRSASRNEYALGKRERQRCTSGMLPLTASPERVALEYGRKILKKSHPDGDSSSRLSSEGSKNSCREYTQEKIGLALQINATGEYGELVGPYAPRRRNEGTELSQQTSVKFNTKGGHRRTLKRAFATPTLPAFPPLTDASLPLPTPFTDPKNKGSRRRRRSQITPEMATASRSTVGRPRKHQRTPSHCHTSQRQLTEYGNIFWNATLGAYGVTHGNFSPLTSDSEEEEEEEESLEYLYPSLEGAFSRTHTLLPLQNTCEQNFSYQSRDENVLKTTISRAENGCLHLQQSLPSNSLMFRSPLSLGGIHEECCSLQAMNDFSSYSMGLPSLSGPTHAMATHLSNGSQPEATKDSRNGYGNGFGSVGVDTKDSPNASMTHGGQNDVRHRFEDTQETAGLTPHGRRETSLSFPSLPCKGTRPSTKKHSKNRKQHRNTAVTLSSPRNNSPTQK
ncbi:hypothetical protein IE077_000420, partial [Cardiosporidium cionae]